MAVEQTGRSDVLETTKLMCQSILDGSIINETITDSSDICEHSANELAKQYSANEALLIADLVQSMEPLLTSTRHDIRAKGVEILTRIIISLPKNRLNEKEIDTIFMFLCLRLVDDGSMHRDVLRCFQYLLHNSNKPRTFNGKLFDSLKHQTNIRNMDPSNRYIVLKLVSDIIAEHLVTNQNITNDLLFGIIHLIEGESDPNCLMLAFRLVATVSRCYRNLEPYAEDLVDWLSSYYPISYTPPPGQASIIKRDDLVDALYDCFIANELFAENVLTLIRDKLESNLVSSKLDSYDCLERCIKYYPLNKIKEFHLSFWTCIRMDCLRPQKSMDKNLFAKALSALTSIVDCLDDDTYRSMVDAIHSDLSLAFSKVEMDLFTSASHLMVHSMQSRASSDCAFDKFINIITKGTSKMINNQEYLLYEDDILGSLKYVFDRLYKIQQSSPRTITFFQRNEASEEFKDEYIRRIIAVLRRSSITLETCSSCLQLINSIISCNHLCKDGQDEFFMRKETLDRLIETINALLDSNRCAKDCIQLLRNIGGYFCIKIVDREELCQLLSRKDHDKDTYRSLVRNLTILTFVVDDSLVPAVQLFLDNFLSLGISSLNEDQTLIWMRIIEVLLHGMNSEKIMEIFSDVNKLNKFLNYVRISPVQINSIQLANTIGRIHAIIINKLDDSLIMGVLMPLLSSDFFQGLVSSDLKEEEKRLWYASIVKWVLKALVIRNHAIAAPIMNLVLNAITLDSIEASTALKLFEIFPFVMDDEKKDGANQIELFDSEKHYKRFNLYKQKFYCQSSKEILIRYNKKSGTSSNDAGSQALLLALIGQIRHLPAGAIKNDYNRLLPLVIKVLSNIQTRSQDENLNIKPIKVAIFRFLKQVFSGDKRSLVLPHLESLLSICLDSSSPPGNTIEERMISLECLAQIATCYDDNQLMPMRSRMISKLRPCLADRKRLVRAKAVEARMAWLVVGQPGRPGI